MPPNVHRLSTLQPTMHSASRVRTQESFCLQLFMEIEGHDDMTLLVFIARPALRHLLTWSSSYMFIARLLSNGMTER